MKILFVMRSTVYVRNFESTLRLLAARGHRVHLVAGEHALYPLSLVDPLCAECPGLSCGPPPDEPPSGWALLGETLRRGVDALRYLEADYDQAPKLRARAARSAPPFVVALASWRLTAWSPLRRVLSRLVRRGDRALPTDPAIDGVLERHHPDLVLVTPLVEPGSPQSAYLRSAQARGVRTGLCVYSWDNLTNKGLIQDALDLVTVWNEPMKQEATALHGVPAERVVVTGVPAYDHWFTWQPSSSREAFCARVGLDPARPYLLYVCSSKFIAPHEVGFVRDWVRRVRHESAVLRGVGVLVRPHPQNVEQWEGVDLGDLGQVAVWPPAGRNPVDVESRSLYYDSIHHSAGVVGVNTSAQIESAVVGRPVFTLLAPEFRDTQGGTLHFRHIGGDDGALLLVGRDMAEHVAQLESALRDPQAAMSRARQFLTRFVRPFGLDQPATPRLVAALERVVEGPPVSPRQSAVLDWTIRRILRRAAERLAHEDRERRDAASRRWREKREKAAAMAARRATAKADRERERQARRERRQQRLVASARTEHDTRERRAAEAARAFVVYQDVRARVRRMVEAPGLQPEWSAAEQRTLAAVQGIWDATPDTIGNLRAQAAPLTGLSPADYESSADRRKPFFLDLGRLLKVGPRALLVPESPVLGGFGHLVTTPEGMACYNDDTLLFFEVLSALDCGALVPEFRRTDRRLVVWEIGGGWGGFAYQFKSLFPGTTYVITGPAELLVFSAVYLKTAFPGARCRFLGDPDSPSFWSALDDVDFAFATEGALHEDAGSPHVGLTLDLMALERMPVARARRHVHWAFAAGSRYVYSLGPKADVECGDLTPVVPLIDERYWSYELPVPQFEGMPVVAGFRGHAPEDGVPRAHRLGWRRVRQ